MSASICRFMSSKDSGLGIRMVNFVLETELKKLKQPFFRPIYAMHIVTRGSGYFKCEGECTEIKRGSLFIAFPGKFFELCGSDDLEYVYISFTGDSAEAILTQSGVEKGKYVYGDFGHLINIWLESLRRMEAHNAETVTLGVLFHTLSYIRTIDGGEGTKPESVVDSIVEYVNCHYDNADLCLRYVAGIFNYTGKYISDIFKKRTGTGFCEYVNNLRIKKAASLMEDGARADVSGIAVQCGFSDPLYFSKVFKTKTGMSPTEYMKRNKK